METKHIHFIGICGVAMSALALAFKKQGWKVTGSDVGFYPPVSTHLKVAGVDFYPGWHPDRALQSFSDGGKDGAIVVVGNVASSTNPEWLYAKEHNLNYKSYPEVIKEFFVKQNSIVCAGTFGKSTSTALLTWILKQNGFDPSYMFGGIALNDIPAAEMSSLQSEAPGAKDWSILEGDEYKASKWDNGAKFFYYSPTHLLLTSVVWDHADVYPTEIEYIAAFKELVELVPLKGLCVLSEKAIPVVKTNRPYISYGKTAGNDYFYTNIKESKNGLTFDIKYKDQTFSLATSCLGEYMADNITGCFALCREIGLAPEKIIAAVATFRGMKRRLEKRFEGAVTVFDDIAHSPTKAQAVIQALHDVYARPHPTLSLKERDNASFSSKEKAGMRSRSRIFAVFEPNTGNRRPQSRDWYKYAFEKADEVIIPHLTKVKIDQDDPDKPFEGSEITKIISETHPNAVYIDDDQKIITHLANEAKPGDVIVFLGSHGFRGMIEELVSKLS